jgi:hypothetical protein
MRFLGHTRPMRITLRDTIPDRGAVTHHAGPEDHQRAVHVGFANFAHLFELSAG